MTSTEGEGEGDPDRNVIDLPSFLQDRPAIGGKWYDYSVDGHVLEPKDEAWVVVDVDGGVHGFRIASVYDEDTGVSGLFTLDVVHLDTEGDPNIWTAPETFVATTNVRDGVACMKLATLSEVACDDGAYDLRFAQQQRLSVFAAFAVAEPAIFLNDGVKAARVDGVSSSGALADLPGPDALADLADDDAGFDSTEWDYAAFAPDLPKRGQLFGALDRVVDGSWALVDGNRGLVEFSVAAVDDDTLRVTLRRQDIDSDDFSVPKDLGEFRDVDVDVSSPPVFLSFANDDVLTSPDDLEGAAWPVQPPFARDYDLVVVDDGAGLRVLMSPASAALHQSAP